MSFITKFITCLSVICLVTSIFNLLGAHAVDGDPVVSVREGKLRGIVLKSRGGRNYYGFLGVHYAAKPERFEVARPPVSWEGTRDATEFGSVCPQQNFQTAIYLGDENCLVNNIYTPKLSGKLPVMVFIHGGAFMWGDGNSYGGKYLMDHDVVLVTMNYRLGALGFLSTEDEAIQGNFGLKDQAESLRWIQKNIEAFGGDPQKITILGYSAGGVSINYHLISPMSRGLFARAIVQSGSALNPWALIRNPVASAKKLSEHLNCPFEEGKKGSYDFKRCLQKKTAKEIVDAQIHFQKLPNAEPISPFAPVIEKVSPDNRAPVFLSESPYKLMTDDKLKQKLNLNISLMIGLCEDDGLIRGGALVNDENEIGLKMRKTLNEDPHSIYPITFLYEETAEKKNWPIITEQIRKFYFGDKIVDPSTAKEITDLYSDRWFNHGVRNSAKYLAKLGVPVYPYIFSYKGKFSFAQMFGSRGVYGGATHLDDLTYIFNITLFSSKLPEITQDEKDFKVSKTLLKLVTTFAETGVPAPQESKNKWEAIKKEDIHNDKEPQWYIINEDSKMGVAPFSSRIKFWDELPQLLEMKREVSLQHQHQEL